MRKNIMKLYMVMALILGSTTLVFAEEQKPEQAVDPNITNLSVGYSLVNEVLPPMPVKPESLNDVKAVTAYLAAVEAYTKAAQKYIDGTTNDLNKIIAQRNLAVQNANKVVEECNAFLDANKKQK